MARRVGIQLAVIAVAGWVTWASCSVYDESMLLPAVAGGTGGSGGGGPTGGTSGEAGADLCTSVRPPTPPASGDPGGSIQFDVAMRTIDFGEPFIDADGGSVPARPLGYDLDRTVTIEACGEGNSCADPKFSPPRNCPSNLCGDVKDFAGGRDNGLGKLITEVGTRVGSFGTQAYNDQIAQGKVSILWRVSGYNGEANDPKVTLTMYSPAAMDSFPDATRTKPEWDGLDVWPVSSESLDKNSNDQFDMNMPKFIDENAFVTNGVIVGSMTRTDLRIKIGVTTTILVELVLRYTQAFFSAEIKRITRNVPTDGGTVQKQLWTLQNGQIVGRWDVDDLLNQIDQFPDPSDITLLSPICRASGSYPTFRAIICSFADICKDLCTPTDPCNAISVGMGFHAEEAIRGDIWELQELQDRCPGEAPDSCFVPLSDAGMSDSGSDASVDASTN